LQSVEMKTRGDERHPAQTIELAEGQGEKRAGTFTLWTDGARAGDEQAGQRLVLGLTSYQLKLKDSEGFESTDTLWRSVMVEPDLPPTVKLHSTGDKLSVKPDAVLPLVADAQDDAGLATVRILRILYRVNSEGKVRELAVFEHNKAPEKDTRDTFEWKLASSGLKVGDRVEYWAEATDRNNITGPGKGESNKLTLEVINPLETIGKLDTRVRDYIAELTKILALQKLNKAETEGGVGFKGLIEREIEIRKRTTGLARAIEADGVPVYTVVEALDKLAAGLMARVVRDFETALGTDKEQRGSATRQESSKDQEKIIKELEEILVRLQRN
jgi:hypothetical protein